MTITELIACKRDGGALNSNEIRWLIENYTSGEVTDYQMSAMTMAVFLNGLNAEELAVWTDAMLHSGDILDFSDISVPKIDKHSTGGVGDKVSIPLAPMVAACGVAIPMMSGRGLGHTGGTLDKLEAIPGFTTELDQAKFRAVLDEVGYVLGGQSDTLVPADKKLYALRNATATVPSIPLISSSIMSKKLAEGLDGLILDIKVGRGAFMKDVDQARLLAQTMIEIGETHDTKVVAFLTNMNQPLGNEIGNASEIRESLAVLNGEGPDDLTEITLMLGTEMLLLAGTHDDADSALSALEAVVASGEALEMFRKVIVAQGGDPSVVDRPELLATTPHHTDFVARGSGVIQKCDALLLGTAAMRLGAGRERKEDDIDPGVGITVHHKIGDPVEKGDALATLHYSDTKSLAQAQPLMNEAFEIGESARPEQLILERITAS